MVIPVIQVYDVQDRLIMPSDLQDVGVHGVCLLSDSRPEYRV